MQRATALMITLLCSACGVTPESRGEPGMCDPLRARLSHNPSRAAELAASKGDRRFLAVAGLTVTVPGIQNAALIKSAGYVILDGTTDAVQDSSCEAYQDEAKAYAQKYNGRLVELEAVRKR